MIISSQELGTQEELIQELAKSGYESTQSTLSRDLRQLQVVKAQNAMGRYVYMLPTRQLFRRVSDTHASVHSLNRLGAISVKFSGNMAVIKTLPGHASHVAYDIDNAQCPLLLGTIAGDDTVFIVMDENADRKEVFDAITTVVPSLA